MKKFPKKTPLPEERKKTVRQEILSLLKEEQLSAGDLSKMVGKSEKEIYEHLSQLQKSVRIGVEPAVCLKCGFVFEGRSRPGKPGKCPQCRSTRISNPRFSYN